MRGMTMALEALAPVVAGGSGELAFLARFLLLKDEWKLAGPELERLIAELEEDSAVTGSTATRSTPFANSTESGCSRP